MAGQGLPSGHFTNSCGGRDQLHWRIRARDREDFSQEVVFPSHFELACSVRCTNATTTSAHSDLERAMGIEPKNLTLRLASSLQRDKHSKSSLCRISDCAQQTAIFCVLKKFTTDRKTSTSPQISDKVLKRSLSIFSDLIFDSKVDRGIPQLGRSAGGSRHTATGIF